MDNVYKRMMIHSSGYISGRVVRWHTWPTIHKPNVAEHQCRVAQLYCDIWGLPRAEVLYFCINHDRGEQWAGDMPFGSKDRIEGMAERQCQAEEDGLERQMVSLPNIDNEELLKFKICDMTEMYEFCAYEINMGNTYAMVPLVDLRAKIMALAAKLSQTSKIERFLKEIYRW